jgi:hypothetical protein
MAPFRKILRITLGCLLLLLGLVGLVIPVLPQVPFLLLGALLLAPHVKLFRRLLAWLHRKYPQSERVTKWFEKYVGAVETPKDEFSPRPSPLDPPKLQP